MVFVGEAVKKLRQQLDLTQREFAELLEVPQSTVWRWETGRSRPQRAHRKSLARLALEHGLPDEAGLGGEKRPEPRAVFERAVRRARARAPATFDRWFSEIRFDSLTEDLLTLRAQNDFVVDWVRSNFLPELVTQIREIAGWSVKAEFVLDPGLENGVDLKQVLSGQRPGPQPLVAAEDDSAGRRGERLPRPEGINARFTFSNFVVGPSNQLAHAAAAAAAGGGGRRYNPLFLCGGTGLGKTHLVHAIASRIREDCGAARIRYVSAEGFTNGFIAALQHQRMDEFRARYREECDLLLVDDIQFLAGRVQTQEEFFHTFNTLHNADRQIVVTSDKYPQALQRMEERLVSRFASGLVADIQAPELETRLAILRMKAASEGIELVEEVAEYLAQSISSNVRELEGMLIRLAAKASLTGLRLDLEFARAEATVVLERRRETPTIDDIQRAVSSTFGSGKES